ncbi:hypothetical protein HPP92_013135 [Vanilla planifolia]|uniref:BHLH domain-containing protein n=1 Tax=Vanilla planifolia TaxID=51239 RepID=A0A835QUC8_VANPL|nr:hypothetical protein HPP92_013135 [Vanilla planifolia]
MLSFSLPVCVTSVSVLPCSHILLIPDLFLYAGPLASFSRLLPSSVKSLFFSSLFSNPFNETGKLLPLPLEDVDMALEAVVFPQGGLICTAKEMYGSGGGPWGWEISGLVDEEEGRQCFHGNWEASCSSMENREKEGAPMAHEEEKAVETNQRRKRRRTKGLKNREQKETQRMTHIAVERNRRRQMNDHLAVLRSLMPPSYVQKGDQASIVGGAINFVKELEHLHQSLKVHKQLKQTRNGGFNETPIGTPLTMFLANPQYSSTNAAVVAATNPNSADAALADIEVTLVESHANLKVLSKRRPKQLLCLVLGLHELRLAVLHLNLTTVEPMVLYSFNLKVEEDCELASADDIAAAVHRIMERFREEGALLQDSGELTFVYS